MNIMKKRAVGIGGPIVLAAGLLSRGPAPDTPLHGAAAQAEPLLEAAK